VRGFTGTSIRPKAMINKQLPAMRPANPLGNLVRANQILLACLFAASLALAGCGASSSSSPPGPGPGPAAHSVILTWDPSSSPSAVGYHVFRSAASGGPYAVLNSSGLVSGLSYTDLTVQPGKTYYYTLTAVDGNGVESRFSGEVSATIPSP
jgi:hypothetical protein